MLSKLIICSCTAQTLVGTSELTPTLLFHCLSCAAEFRLTCLSPMQWFSDQLIVSHSESIYFGYLVPHASNSLPFLLLQFVPPFCAFLSLLLWLNAVLILIKLLWVSHYPIFPSLPLCTVCWFFVSWVRVTSLTHFSQPNWESSFATDEAISWCVCCAPRSLRGGRLPWGRARAAFFCACTCWQHCSGARAPAGCGAVLGLLCRVLPSRKASSAPTSFGFIAFSVNMFGIGDNLKCWADRQLWPCMNSAK